MLWNSLILLAFTFPVAFCVTCYICGDSNLDEFGECTSQFQYDCVTYESRFPADERIYCRTTRQRAKNNTFTIMKECISEQDHYRTFPEKGYRLDEECDLVEINGEEVAYCLCRSDLCNRNPIAEQFMAFEEKHPELFGDVGSSPPASPKQPARESFRGGEAPLKIQSLPTSASAASFAAPILNPPAIVPINDLRSQKSSESTEVRRAQLPSRAQGIETEISSIPSRSLSTSKETEVPIMNLPQKSISEGTFVGSGTNIINPIVVPRRGDNSDKMRCIQCGDGSLINGSQECKRQIQVDCPSSKSMCFTRQISLGNGMFGMEKMCVLPDQLINEFGAGAQHEGCGSSNGGRVQYCACSSLLCNQLPLTQQMQIFNSIAPSESRTVPELAAPELPVPSPPPTTTDTPQPIVPVVNNHRQGGGADGRIRLKCVTCAEADMSDPTADCSSMSEQMCDSTTRFCVTKQTQISTSSFAIEKKCLSDVDATKFLPGEKLEDGCATSEGGMVNFCLCSANSCNHHSLLQQAQMTGVRDSLEEQRMLEEHEIQRQKSLSTNSLQTTDTTQNNAGIMENRLATSRGGGGKKLPPVFLDEDDSLEVQKDVRSEDDLIRERQREWAEMNVNKSKDRRSTFNILTATTTFLMMLFLR